ncbi:hypothetical protein SNE40_015265 [Patella caerulea]|uniref:Cilia- and flagella-associated protein 54 n=1 Tax=Patella caerulea TaxID=87958 RepID=A0AAN8PIW3_PATCE
MAAFLINAAASSTNRGRPSAFFGSEKNNSKTNPVLQALDTEITLITAHIIKRSGPNFKKPEKEPCSRMADSIFKLWNRYEPKLPKAYYQKRLLEMGDYLMAMKEYKIALSQCYERYLLCFERINFSEITDGSTLEKLFFPNGFDTDNSGLTFRALMGKSISMYQIVKLNDPKLQNRQSVDECLQILSFLRLIMQIVLPKEPLCWLIYNGSIHIYTISRHLMSLGHSAQVLEYVIWASICMESSIPLMSVKYLPWRSTLYTAVCQCYYDCKAGQHAEAFARRGLAKINELSQLEMMSNADENPQIMIAFRESTIKMAIMVYKRSVFETRRKPKGLLRPKTRTNYKDIMNWAWPRTTSEKLMAEMFDGTAAQFLALLESLSDSNRRIILTSPPAQDNEPEVLDVFVELFMTGQELLAGGGGNKLPGPKSQSALGAPPLSGVTTGASLMDLAIRGEDGIPISAAIRFVKLAYNYEHWEVFDSLVEPLLIHLSLLNEEEYFWDEKALELLLAMEKLNSNKKHKKNAVITDELGEEGQLPSDPNTTSLPGTAMKSTGMHDDHINLADVLISIVSGSFKKSAVEIDIIVDAALFLWNKCKAVFQKYQTGSVDNPRYLYKMDQPHKWMYLLDTVHQTLCWCGVSSVDPALTAEVVLRLAMFYESSAYLETMDGKKNKTDVSTDENKSSSQPSSICNKRDKSALKDSKTTLTDICPTEINHSRISILSPPGNISAKGQLLLTKSILELGLIDMSYARQAVGLNDGKSIADVCWVKELNPAVFQQQLNYEVSDLGEEINVDDLIPDALKESATSVWNTVKDLHLELLLMYHRVCLKLAALKQEEVVSKSAKEKKKDGSSTVEIDKTDDAYISNFDELSAACKKNNISRALLYMESALLSSRGGFYNGKQKKLLEESANFIKKAQQEEKRIFLDNQYYPEDIKTCENPPPPLLLSRTDTTMVFRPAPYTPANGQKVAWYRLFGRNATGSNIKVRANDNFLPGTGDQVPAVHTEMHVSGLIPNERYVFAVAAYDVEGNIIGSVGNTSKPILASHPLPVLMTWAFLVQISYQVGFYDVTRQAFDVLWDYFIMEKPEPTGVTYVTPDKNDFKLTLNKLNQRAICLSSPVLLRQFLTSIFVNTDVSIREGQLFCDVLCDKGPLYKNQVSRLVECEKLLIGIELSGWLNEANLALQCVIQCYGLLAPLLFYKIPSHSVIQILQRSHSVLQEIPTGLIVKRQGHIGDSLHHMTACITFHMARALRTWGQKTLANSINEAGRKLLAIEGMDKEVKQEGGGDKSVDQPDSPSIETSIEMTAVTLQALKKRRHKKIGLFNPKDEIEPVINEELKALEAHILRLTKASQNEMELSGNEDPNILHAYIAFLPARMAHKEVLKFKRRARYLEFVVQVAQKGLLEGLAEQVIDWCEDCVHWLQKRNEQIIGNRAYMTKQPGAITVSGDDPRKFAAAMVEYSKDKETSPPKTNKPGQSTKIITPAMPTKTKRKKYRPFNNYSNMSDAARHALEDKENKAIEALSLYFADMYRSAHKKRRMRKIHTDELPWRSQMKIVLGMSYFSAFLQKLEKREKILGSAGSNMYRSSFLDHEWFTFETADTLVVGWDGGPTRQSSRHATGQSADDRAVHTKLDLNTDADKHKTAIEIAAAAVTGVFAPIPGTKNPIQEFDDTPRTYRSDFSAVPETRPTKRHQEDESALLSTKATLQALDKTFTYLKQCMIIAYRGNHWTMFQNACNTLWNCAHTALLRATTANQSKNEAGLLTVEVLRSLVWKPFYLSVDCLLDMMVKLQINLDQQAAKAMNKKRVLGTYFEDWYGSIQSEKGGASLKFEDPLDDRSVLDVRWIRRYVLRVIEMLYYEQKWEKLVDIALRFNAITNDRYAEQVLPLLVQAQRKLTGILKQVGGCPPPQKHYQTLLTQLGGVISAKDYLQCQLKVEVDKTNVKPVEPGAHIDPLGHNVYSPDDARRLISVPLDYEYSLDTLRQVLSKSHYSARALHHSRKLLVLYLAGQQNIGTDSMLPKSPSKVDFLKNTAHPQPTAPPDLSTELYLSTDDVQTSPVPKSQLPFIIESYEKTIDTLIVKKQKGLAAQAMFELGNLHYHTKNLRSTFKWWCDALDIVLNTNDAIHSWRATLAESQDESRDLLERCGLWGCVLGGIISSCIAQYILTSDLGLRMDCCFLSGYFFKALFRASMPHPVADRDYALYDVGEGCEVTNLVPGIDLLSERFRADGRQVVAALRWVTEELSRGRHNLFVLPLLTLYQYFTNFVCRDLQRSVDGRILKVRVLTDLNLFTEAFIILRRLLHGERLPQVGDSGFRHVESKVGSIQFNTSKPILDTTNLKILEGVIDKRLPSNLASLYGPHLTCHLLLVQAHLLVTVADTLPVIPALSEAAVPSGALESQFIVIKTRTISTGSHVGMGTRAPRLVSATSHSIDVEEKREGADEESENEIPCYNRRFTESKKKVTIEIVKATLLNMAEQMVTTLSDVIVDSAEHDKTGKGVEKLSASELELVVLCKLEQGYISRQKHHAPLAAHGVFSALKLIQTSDLFKPQKCSKTPSRKTLNSQERPSSLKGHNITTGSKLKQGDIKLTQSNNTQFQYQNFQSRSRLDTRLWLKCRLELIKCLMLEIKGMGDVKGSENKFVTELADCRQYCIEGVGEAEMLGDIEMQAEFFIQGAFLNMIEGKNLEHTVSLLQEASDQLDTVAKLSEPGQQLVVLCQMLITDLELITRGGETNILEQTLNNYIKIQNNLLTQIESLGEKIERYRSGKDQHHSSLVTPIKNIYLPHLLRLCQLKLRIGHRLARNAAITASKGLPEQDAVYLWIDAYGVLVSALDLSRSSVNRDSSLEAEILFDLGKVQKMMMYLGKFPPRKAANTIIEAIKTSYCTDHNLSLIRQAYLEISQIYLYSSNQLAAKEVVPPDTAGDSGDESNITTPVPPNTAKPPGSSQSKKKWKSKKEKASKSKESKEEDTVAESETERRAAWLAIRCAAATGQAQRERLLLKGNMAVTQKLTEKAIKEIPDFLALDLVGAYVLGEKKKIYKNEIEEELSTMVEVEEVKQTDTYEEQIVKAKIGSQDLSWIQLLGYQTILQRMSSTQTTSAFSVPTVPDTKSNTQVDGGDLGPDFDLGFISHAQSSTTSNNELIKYMLCSGPWVARMTSMHHYLAANLPSYSANCCAIYPPAGLMLQVPQTPTNVAPTIKSYSSNMSESTEQDIEGSTCSLIDVKTFAPPGFIKEPYMPSDKTIVTPEDNEICLQWYQPTLEESDPSQPDSPDKKIMLLFALFKKNATATFSPGYLWVSLAQLNDLHDRLAVLTQRGEISLLDKQKKEPSLSSSQSKLKKTQRIKALSPKLQRDGLLENLLSQCLEDCCLLLASQTEQDSPLEIPFEVNKTNIKSLEALFDPALGQILKNGDLLSWLLKLFP